MTYPGVAPSPFEGTQTLVLHGVPHRCVLHLLVHCPPSMSGTGFLLGVLGSGLADGMALGPDALAQDQLDAAAPLLSIGLTFRGLQRLHVPEPVLAPLRRRAPAFVAGAAARAAVGAGDAGGSAAEHWQRDWKIPPHALHMVLSVHGDDDAVLAEAQRVLRGIASTHGITLQALPQGAWFAQPGRAGQWVHFGYRDGLSSPRIDGWHARPDGVQAGQHPSRPHAAGEFLLGHAQDSGANPWQLSAAPDSMRLLYRNASFGVLRQIEQDEAAFDAFVDLAASRLAATRQLDMRVQANAQRLREFVKAKLMGRWPAGQQLKPDAQPETPLAPGLPHDLELDYAGDGDGHGCPFGAHIRRMNPRESGAQLAHSERRRVLLRRGMPYGPPYRDAPDHARGLMGLFFCASLEEQFEHITGQWGAGIALGSGDRGTAHDLFVAAQPAGARLEIPLGEGLQPLVLQPPDCVRTRGSAYLLYASRPALEHLASSETWKEVRWDEP